MRTLATDAESPAPRPAAAAEAGVPDALMAMCLLLMARYLRQLWGEPTAEECRAKARHRRPTGPRDPASPLDRACGARLRDGSLCERPPVEGRRRCRSHGCAPGAGAPKGNRNALKHGCFTAIEMAREQRISDFIRESRETMRLAEKAARGRL